MNGNFISNFEKNISSNLKANVKFNNGKISLDKETEEPSHNPFSIIDIDSANNAINVVPKYCSISIQTINSETCLKFISNAKKIIEKYNYEIDLYKIDDTHIKITSYGTASHSAHPEYGVNAISKLIVVLNDVFKEFNFKHNLFSEFCKFIGDDYYGKNLNLNLSDESGLLTLNTSQLYLKDNKICIGINLRIPVHTNPEYIISTFKEHFVSNVDILKTIPALYIDKNSKLVKKLNSIFNEICQTNFEPIAIGGATYARAFPNCVSFGMNFPGDKDMCHHADEFVDINKLLLSTNIYAKTIFELLNN